MIFDKMAEIAERIGNKQVIQKLCDARLFCIDENLSMRGRDEHAQLDVEQVKIVNENFTLPFPITAIESPRINDADDFDFCMVLGDAAKDQQGVGPRMFMLCAEANDKDTQCRGCVYFFMWGMTVYMPEIKRYGLGIVRLYTYHDKMGLKCLVKPGMIPSNEIKTVASDVGACINPVMIWFHYINQPCHFIVSNESATPIKTHANRPIVRSKDRTIYTVLKPEEIKKRFNHPEITTEPHGTKAPHERRRHLRTYKAEHYKAMRGKTQWIPACWVGPSECVIGKRIYKVMLDI